MHHEHPQLVKDQYWDERFPPQLPYANEPEGNREEPPESSTAKIDFAKLPSVVIYILMKLDKWHMVVYFTTFIKGIINTTS